MASYLSVTDLVTRAKNGEQQAWDALVERYATLIWTICRRTWTLCGWRRWNGKSASLTVTSMQPEETKL